jgi:hypothetical protein
VRVLVEDGANSGEILDTIDRHPENGDVAVAGRQKDTHMGFVRVLATILFIIALPVAIVTTNIRLLANSPWTYDYAFDRYDAEESTGLSREDLDSTAPPCATTGTTAKRSSSTPSPRTASSARCSTPARRCTWPTSKTSS